MSHQHVEGRTRDLLPPTAAGLGEMTFTSSSLISQSGRALCHTLSVI